MSARRWSLYEEALAACVSSKIPQLHETPRDIVTAPSPQEPSDAGNPRWSRMLCRVVHRGNPSPDEGKRVFDNLFQVEQY